MKKINPHIFPALSRLHFLAKAKHKRGFGIHSPFLWKLWRDCIGISGQYYARERLQKALHTSACHQANNFPRKYPELCFRLSNYFAPDIIVSAGDRISIAPLYMAAAAPSASVYALENSTQTGDKLARCSRVAEIHNISIIKPNKNKSLHDVLYPFKKIDMAYIKPSTSVSRLQEYFDLLKCKADNNSVFIFETPYSTKQTAHFWNTIQNDSEISLSLDLYGIGIVFLKKELSKEHFLIKY